MHLEPKGLWHEQKQTLWWKVGEAKVGPPVKLVAKFETLADPGAAIPAVLCKFVCSGSTWTGLDCAVEVVGRSGVDIEVRKQYAAGEYKIE